MTPKRPGSLEEPVVRCRKRRHREREDEVRRARLERIEQHHGADRDESKRGEWVHVLRVYLAAWEVEQRTESGLAAGPGADLQLASCSFNSEGEPVERAAFRLPRH